MIHPSRAAAAAKLAQVGPVSPPTLLSYGLAFLTAQRHQQGEGDYTAAVFETELTLLLLKPASPADAVALTMVALDVIDRNQDCEHSETTEREAVAAMRAIRRSVRLLAAATNVDVRQVLGGYYVDECRPALLEPDERATSEGAVT